MWKERDRPAETRVVGPVAVMFPKKQFSSGAFNRAGSQNRRCRAGQVEKEFISIGLGQGEPWILLYFPCY